MRNQKSMRNYKTTPLDVTPRYVVCETKPLDAAPRYVICEITRLGSSPMIAHASIGESQMDFLADQVCFDEIF